MGRGVWCRGRVGGCGNIVERVAVVMCKRNVVMWWKRGNEVCAVRDGWKL